MTAASAPIVCGVDFSADSQRALQCAAALATRLGCPVTLVSAIEPLLAEAATLRGAFDAFAEEHKKLGLRLMEGIASVLASRLRYTNAELRVLES